MAPVWAQPGSLCVVNSDNHRTNLMRQGENLSTELRRLGFSDAAFSTAVALGQMPCGWEEGAGGGLRVGRGLTVLTVSSTPGAARVLFSFQPLQT